MPLPLILGIGAAVAGAAGIGNGIHGAVKMKEANDTMKEAEKRHKKNQARFEAHSEQTTSEMDELGKLELNILAQFEHFSDLMERIQNRPEFKSYSKDGVDIPKYDKEKLKEVYVGAGVLLGGLGGAAAGTAGGFAAAGATTSAVMALGTASTGTAIASLSGVAATNATLAALGGGALAAGGGGMALGTTILGVTTLGVGLLVGGVIFNVTGQALSGKADEAWSQMIRAEKQIDTICDYLDDLLKTAMRYEDMLKHVSSIYQSHYNHLYDIVQTRGKTNWNDFTEAEQLCTENTALLVGVLYDMCKVQLVHKSENENAVNKVNHAEVDHAITSARKVIAEKELTI